jgi:hypothetical protein
MASLNGNTDVVGGMIPFVPILIPAGTRLSARAASGGTNAMGLTLFGIYQ